MNRDWLRRHCEEVLRCQARKKLIRHDQQILEEHSLILEIMKEGDELRSAVQTEIDKRVIIECALGVSKAHDAKTEKKYDDVLKELEKIGWPCRLIELPAEHDKLVRQYTDLQDRIEKAIEVMNSADDPQLAVFDRIHSALKG